MTNTHNAASEASQQAAAAPSEAQPNEQSEVGEPTALEAALRELIKCEHVRYNLRSGLPERVYAEFRARSDAAWQSARAALALQQEPKP